MLKARWNPIHRALLAGNDNHKPTSKTRPRTVVKTPPGSFASTLLTMQPTAEEYAATLLHAYKHIQVPGLIDAVVEIYKASGLIPRKPPVMPAWRTR